MPADHNIVFADIIFSNKATDCDKPMLQKKKHRIYSPSIVVWSHVRRL